MDRENFPGGSVIRNPSASAGYSGSIPGPGKIPHAAGQLSSSATATESAHPGLGENTCLCTAESLSCSPETITALLIDYTSIQNKMFEKKKERGISLVLQGLRLHIPSLGGPGLVPCQGIRSSMLLLRPGQPNKYLSIKRKAFPAPPESGCYSLQLEKDHMQQQRPSTVINKCMFF